MCARRRTYFLLRRQKKVGKEKATPSLRPPYALSGERGQPAMLGTGVVPQNSLRSSNFAQTAAASQITKCVCPSAHTPTPAPALLGAASRGGERVPHGCCFAATPGVGDALRAADRPKRSEANRAERSDGPYGARSQPLLTVPRSAGPGVSACRRTRASLSSLPQLFERSSKNEASSAAHPRHEHRRLPHLPSGEWGHGQRGRLSFGYFSLAKQRTSTSAAGPRPGSRPQARHAATLANEQKSSLLLQRIPQPPQGRDAYPTPIQPLAKPMHKHLDGFRMHLLLI
jgi:hypothetical protein